MRKIVPIGDVAVHPLNIRLIRLTENVTRLAESIKQNGQEYPLKVVRGPGGKFLCWDGGYRLAACKMAGLKRVKIDIEEIRNETELILRSFNAADKAVPFNPIEEARTFKTLWDRLKALDKVCEATGRRRSYIFDRLALLRLIPRAQRLVLKGKMTWLPAFRLSGKSKDVQAKVLQILAATPPDSSEGRPKSSRYNLWDIDAAVRKVTGRDKKIFPPAPKQKGTADWRCPHCGKRYKATCLEDGRHLFERQ